LEQYTDNDLYSGDITSLLSTRIVNEEKNIFPEEVAIETTTFCNLNCVMCFREKLTRKKTNMRWPLYIKLIEEIANKAKNSTRVWLCFAGEPLMGKDFVDRVIFAKSKGIANVVINSNMCLMNSNLAEDVVKSGLNNIFVGLDATTADVYSKVRRGGVFERTVKNIIYYKEMLGKYGKPDQEIVVQFIDMPINHHQRDDFIEFWRACDIKVKLRPYVTFLDTNDIKHDYKMSKVERLPCHWAMNILPVSADGFSVWCGCDYDGKCIIGDLNMSSIEEVWSTAKKEQRLQQINRQWDELPGFCRDCPDWISAYAKYE